MTGIRAGGFIRRTEIGTSTVFQGYEAEGFGNAPALRSKAAAPLKTLLFSQTIF
jgi:hypothetical protein